MGYYRVEAGVARLMKLGLEHELPERIEAWQKDLEVGRLTEEMRQVFAGLGWLSSLRDGRLQSIDSDDPETVPRAPRRRGRSPVLPPADEQLLDTAGSHSD